MDADCRVVTRVIAVIQRFLHNPLNNNEGRRNDVACIGVLVAPYSSVWADCVALVCRTSTRLSTAP